MQRLVSYPKRVGINWITGSACVVSNSCYRKWYRHQAVTLRTKLMYKKKSRRAPPNPKGTTISGMKRGRKNASTRDNAASSAPRADNPEPGRERTLFYRVGEKQSLESGVPLRRIKQLFLSHLRRETDDTLLPP